MHIVTKSINNAMNNENWFAALFMSLSLPGLCGGLEFNQEDDNDAYCQWFDKYLPEYNGLLTGRDCFLVQQAVLFKHLTPEHLRVVERFHFILPSKNKTIHKSIIDGVIQLEIDQFCTHISNAFEQWVEHINQAAEIQKKLEQLSKLSNNLLDSKIAN